MTTTLTSSTTVEGCGCSACQAAAAAARDELSSDYTGTASPTLSEAYSLNTGYRWGTGTSGTTITYKFFTALPSYYSSTDDEARNFAAFNAQMQGATERILDQIETFTNINFVKTTSSTTQMGFAQASLPSSAGAWAYYPSQYSSFGGDVWTNNIYSSTQNPAEGNYGFYTLMHEIGHALGLQHSFTAGLTGDEASSRYTVMAYDWSPFFASSYMIYDIAVLQKIYGANMSYHTGNDTYVTNGSLAYTIWDAGGVDTLDASAQSGAVTLDLRDGQYSTVGLTRNIGIAYGAVIENAYGGNGNDVLIGNAANNDLRGNGGNDTFIGSLGTDAVDGGNGIDLLVFDTALGNFIVNLINSVSVLLEDYSGAYGTTTATNVENFEFAGTRYSFADLSAAVLSGITVSPADDVSISVFSSFTSGGKVRKYWTDITSNMEGDKVYAGNDFRYKFTADILDVHRSDSSGADTLILTAHSGFEAYLKTITISDMGTTGSFEFNNIRSLTLSDSDVTQDITATLNGNISTTIVTGSGEDVLDINSVATGRQKGNIVIMSGLGDDEIDVSGTSTGLKISINAGGGDDHVVVTSSAGARIVGGDGNDVLIGGNGHDVLIGDTGNDTLEGKSGRDALYGNDGDDVFKLILDGDVAFGGNGADLFVFESIPAVRALNNIRDFNAAEDRIDISALLSGYDPVTDAISDFVRITTNKKGTFIQIDQDGTDTAQGLMTIAQVNGLKGSSLDDLINTNHLIVT